MQTDFYTNPRGVSLRTSWNQFTLINKLEIGPDVLMLLFHKTEGTIIVSFYAP